MDEAIRKALASDGWRFGDAEDFLELSVPERRFVDLRARLAAAVRRLRRAKGLTQKEAAREFGSSQARVVDIEHAVSTLDMMFRAYFALGGELSKLDELGSPLSAEEWSDVTRSRPKKGTKLVPVTSPEVQVAAPRRSPNVPRRRIAAKAK